MATEPAARPTPALRREAQTAMYRRALGTLPGGTDSNFRAWGDDTVYVDRGKGGMVWDIDGNEYIDLRLGYGPVILGHGDERVDDYVNERMRKGVSFSLTSRGRGRGDGAGQGADRLGRQGADDRVGHRGDDARDARRPGLHRPRQDREVRGPVPRRPRLRPDQRRAGRHVRARRRRRAGRAWPGAGASRTRSPTRSSRPATTTSSVLRRLFEERGEEIAAIIVEPVLGNAQGILPKPGFHQAMRALTEEFGILLIFDEVKTGFRFARGGAAEFFGITPDLATYAKAMGNGYPAAAFGGREEVMSVLPDKVSHGGTYAGNRVAAAAAVKTLTIIRETERARDDPRHRPAASRPACARSSTRPGLPVRLHRPSVMFGIMFTDDEPTEYRDWANTDHELYDAIAVGMHARGAMPEPDSREPWFLCEAHAAGRHVDRVVSIFSDSLDAALEARAKGAVHRDAPRRLRRRGRLAS